MNRELDAITTVSNDESKSAQKQILGVYFNLSRMIVDLNREEYQVVLQAYIPIENGQLSKKSADIWLDNIKLVHF